MELGILKSLNTNYGDIPLTEEKIVFGRNPKSTILLVDKRCSGYHCTITPIFTKS